jgi:curli biogenesis system outer membrane secretion channel CsgG
MAHRVAVPALVILVLVCLGQHPASAQDKAAKPAIAIADVDVRPGGWTLPPPEVGGAIAELLLAELVSSSQFRVYDGQWLVPEGEGGPRLSLDRLRAAAVASHVDYVVLGTITQFATERASRAGGGLIPKPLVAGGFARRRTITTIGVTIKLVDARTGEVVATAVGNGRGSRTARKLGVLGLALPFGGGGSRSSQARDAMVDEAVRQAVHLAASNLVKFAPRLTTAEVVR